MLPAGEGMVPSKRRVVHAALPLFFDRLRMSGEKRHRALAPFSRKSLQRPSAVLTEVRSQRPGPACDARHVFLPAWAILDIIGRIRVRAGRHICSRRRETLQPKGKATAAVVEVEHLTKYYGDCIAVEDVTFTVNRGEIVGFLGPNAAGKTTTMRIITGFLPPSAGTVRISGRDILRDSLEARRLVGYLPETVPLYMDMTVREYLAFMGSLRAMDKAKLAQRSDYVIERLRLETYANSLIAKLSKGFRQRVGIAQAILHEPEVLVLDEPTIGIDPVQVVETRELIKSLGKEHTVILSTHILPEVSLVCERVVVINEGRIVAVDKPENLSVRLRGSEQIKLEVRGPMREVIARLRQVEGVREVSRTPMDNNVVAYMVECEPGSNLRERLASLIVQQGWGLLGLQAAAMSLEDIFLELTTQEEAPKPQEAKAQ